MECLEATSAMPTRLSNLNLGWEASQTSEIARQLWGSGVLLLGLDN
jgi:hypothetical protein